MAMARSLMGDVRPAAVAGLFYPSNPDELRAAVYSYLAADAASADIAANGDSVKAAIAPHAGYRYSGRTAGAAYRVLAPRSDTVERVVVVGPAHRIRLDGIGLSTARAWATPLGEAEVDVALCDDLAEVTRVSYADAAHAPEHSIEVHLPFVQVVFGDVPVVPLLVGQASVDEVARVLDIVWGGDETAVVVSSDLSHYLDDIAARRRDRRTADAILDGRVDEIGPHDACGCLPIAGLLTAALEHRLAPRLLRLSTSADTTGERARVVGYGSFALLPRPDLGEADRQWLADLARRVIDHELDHGEPLLLDNLDNPDDVDVPAAVRAPGASFVTLERDDELLGCIGSLEPQRALWRDVVHNARGAAFDDPRFPALAGDAWDGVSVEVSILSPLEEIPAAGADDVASRLRPGVDGLVLVAEGRRGTFLPDVWDKIPKPIEFVHELLLKAGCPGPWIEGTRAWRYTTLTAQA